MKKIVINTCFGGFSLSPHAVKRLAELQGNDTYAAHHLSYYEIERDNPLLIQVIEELGEKADGTCAKLKIVEIPDDVAWTIEKYDGNEHVAEKHQTWG